jgi:hypothetical protein
MTTTQKEWNNEGGMARFRVAAVAFTMAGMLTVPIASLAQKGGGGGGGGKSSTASDSKQDKQDQKDAEKAKCPEIVGNHALLEKMAEDLNLTCPQEDKIEPMLHDEESVSKPLLAYEAFTQDEKDALMLKVKLAARVQIRPVLTPDQQKKSDAEAAALADSANQPKKGGKKGGKPKKVTAKDDAFKGEDDLSNALAAYKAFSVKERQQYILEVKQAARRDGAPALTVDQSAKVDADIVVLQQQLQPKQ